MPDDTLESQVSPGQVVREFRHLIGELRQYLEDQQSMGITHVEVETETLETVSAWGTRAWNQHRFLFQGPSDARIMIVDSKGGFYGDKAGRLLVKILQAMHLTPDQVYICNTADLGKIRSRVKQSLPEVIITLGREAAELLLGKDLPPEQSAGRFHPFCGTRVMPTRHPEELLTDQTLKRGVWEDMQKVMAQAGLGHDR